MGKQYDRDVYLIVEVAAEIELAQRYVEIVKMNGEIGY